MEQNFINHNIRCNKIRIVGTEYGPFDTDLKSALAMAKEKKLDLIQVSFIDGVAICKMMELGKWKYQQEKNKKAQPNHSLKEFKFGINISEHDIETKVNHAKELLEKNHPIKVVVFLKNWQMKDPQNIKKAEELYKNVISKFENINENSMKITERMVFGTLTKKKV